LSIKKSVTAATIITNTHQYQPMPPPSTGVGSGSGSGFCPGGSTPETINGSNNGACLWEPVPSSCGVCGYCREGSNSRNFS